MAVHNEANQFVISVKKQMPEFFIGKKVLEVGSLDINGSVRQFFENCDYTGLDLGEGPGVDRIAHVTALATLGRLAETYDVILSIEALEHDNRWATSLRAMVDLLRYDGLLLITCAAPNRPEHGTTRTGSAEASPFTSDYYRNISVEDFASVLPANLFSKSYLGYRGNMDDLYFAGIKKEQSLSEEIRTEWHEAIDKSRSLPSLTVTAEISTKDRYTTTLPMCIAAILMQTHKPDKLVIYDDGEQKDLRELPPFDGLLQLALDLGIEWTFYSTERKGQVANHQHALDNATTDLIFRIDDDVILEPDCLEKLLAGMVDDVGAVAPLIHHPGGVTPLPANVDGSLNDIALGVNVQWFDLIPTGAIEVEHLNNSFLYRVSAARKAGGYPRNLSVVGHREESIFSHNIKRSGKRLLVVPCAKAYHLRQSTGGIRSVSDTSLWAHDEEIWQQYLGSIGRDAPDAKMIVADMGLGDHLLLRALLIDEFSRKFPNRKWTIAACYPETLQDIPNVSIISIADAKTIIGDRYGEFSLFEYGWHHGNGRHVLDVMREFWGQ